jgi:hypothetical protein
MISRVLNSCGSGKWQVAECGLHKMQGHFVTRWLCCRELMCFVATVTRKEEAEACERSVSEFKCQ